MAGDDTSYSKFINNFTMRVIKKISILRLCPEVQTLSKHSCALRNLVHAVDIAGSLDLRDEIVETIGTGS